MVYRPDIIIIGAADRNVGKTEFASELIRRLAAPGHPVLGVKITTIKEEGGRCPRGGTGCGVCTSLQGRYEIIEEQTSGPAKDTHRMLAAGASKVYWLRVLHRHLAEGLSELLKLLPPGIPVVCESNSARLALHPGLFLVLRRHGSSLVKPSCAKVIDYADRLVEFTGDAWDLTPRQLRFADGIWQLPHPNATAIILAGGESRRMARDKSMLPVCGQPMIGHIASQLRPLFATILIGANAPEKYAFLGCPVVPDQAPGAGPLMGMASCLAASNSELNFIIGCDIPTVQPGLIRQLLEAGRDADIAIPRTAHGPEPLFAVYRRSTVLPLAHQLLAAEKRRITELLPGLKVTFLDLEKADWYHNLNTPKEYRGFCTEQDNHETHEKGEC